MGDGSVREGQPMSARRHKSLYEKLRDCVCSTPCSCWLPTLLVDPKDDQHFRTTCALALSSLGEEDPKDFSGRWNMTPGEKTDLLQEIELSIAASYRDSITGACVTAHNNSLEIREIEKFQKEHHDRIMQLPNSVHGICNHHLMVEAFNKYDLDANGSLDVHEWSDFLDTLAVENLKSLLRDAHVAFRAFFARGQPWREKDGAYDVEEMRLSMLELATGQPTVERESSSERGEVVPLSGRSAAASPPEFQCSWDGPRFRLPVGWWPDLVYYSANNHPLHGIFACDNEHPLSWIERLVMEVASIGFSAATLALHDKWVIQHRGLNEEDLVILGNEFVFSLVVVTLPSVVMWWTLFLLFTCAKCHPNAAKVTEQEVIKARRWRSVGAAIGYMLVIVGVAGWFCMRYLHTIGRRLHRARLVKGRLKAYFIATFMMAFVYFNPFVAWGQPVPGGRFNLGDYIGLGQWRIEKQRFQAMCLTGAKRIQESRDSDASRQY